MDNSDNHGKQRRGSSPQHRDIQQVCDDWTTGLRSVKQTLSGGSSIPAREMRIRSDDWMRRFHSIEQTMKHSTDLFAQNSRPGQAEGPHLPSFDHEIEPQQIRDDEGHWQDDGGEAG